MSPDFRVNQNQPMQQKDPAKNLDQKLESKLSEYAKSTSRSLPEGKEVQQSINQLKNQTMTLKTFVKNLLNSTNTNDLNNVETMTRELGLEVARDTLPQAPKQAKRGGMMQGKGATQSKSESTMPDMGRNISIIQTSATAELASTAVIKLVKEGNGKQAATTLNSAKGEVLGKVLSSFSSLGQLNQIQIRALVTLLENVVANEGHFPPEMMEEVRKKLKKGKKALGEVDDAADIDEADVDGLSAEAKSFVRDLKSLTKQIGELPGEMPSDLADAYSSLLAKLGVEDQEDL